MRTKLGKVGFAVALIAGLVCMSACGSLGKKEAEFKGFYNEAGEYVKNGSLQYFYHIEDGEKGQITVQIQKESGSIDLVIYADGDEEHPIYEDYDVDDDEYSVSMEPGVEYNVWLYYHDFVGSDFVGMQEN